MNTDVLYAKTTNIYLKAVQQILKKNQDYVNALAKDRPSERRPHKPPVFDQSIIPSIRPIPKANFLSISPANIFTDDDPILRYIPSIRTDGPTYITWYDEVEIGERSIEVSDSIDRLFMANTSHAYEAKAKYLRDLGRKIKDPLPSKKMRDCLCKTCSMFACGIHPIRFCSILKYNETAGCICKVDNHILKDPQLLVRYKKDCLASAADGRWASSTEFRPVYKLCKVLVDVGYANCLPGLTKYCGQSGRSGSKADALPQFNEVTIEHLMIMRGNARLKGCIMSRIAKLRFGVDFSCSEVNTIIAPIKKYTYIRRRIVSREFYEPCYDTENCLKDKCTCASKATSCELACGCVACSNIHFCRCIRCGEDCSCFLARRECSELCKCATKLSGKGHSVKDSANAKGSATLAGALECLTFKVVKPSKVCQNRNLQMQQRQPVSVCESPKHGYGLYASSPIKKGAFVLEYTGELISDKEAERRGNFYELNRCSYQFNLVKKDNDWQLLIDAFYLGNKSRYINHSKFNANLRADTVVCNGMAHIVFFSLRDIYPGEELLFDYMFTPADNERHGIKD